MPELLHDQPVLDGLDLLRVNGFDEFRFVGSACAPQMPRDLGYLDSASSRCPQPLVFLPYHLELRSIARLL